MGPLPVEQAVSSQPLESWDIWRFSAWGPWLSVRLFHTVIFLLGAYLLDRALRLLLKRVKASVREDDPVVRGELERRAETVTAILGRVGRLVLYFTASLMILNDFRVEIGPMLAGLGIVGLAVGFGAQYLVRDVISGFFIVLEDQFRVGDVVKVGNFAGTVEHIFLRTTQIRAANGDLHIVPNGQITLVTNMTRQWSRAVLDVGVGYGSNIDQVFEALRETGRQVQSEPDLEPHIKEPFDIVGVTSLGESAITIRMWAKVDPLQQWAIENALRKRAKEVFDARGIEIPFPQRTLSLDKATAELLRTRLKGGA
ncbi:MAG: mechanosensitive ion channel family protein [Acidobacteriota bacterium]